MHEPINRHAQDREKLKQLALPPQMDLLEA